MESQEITVLLIEDNAGDARFLQELLKESTPTTFTIVHAARLADGIDQLAEHRFDIVLLDLSLPDASGIETLQRTRKAVADVPIVVMTGFDDEVFALRSVREGAQDYLTKGKIEPDLLIRSIRYAIERQRLQSRQEELERQVRQFQKMEAVGQLAAGVAHDFNNFLSIIQGHLHSMTKRRVPPEFAHALKQVGKAADSAAELTRQLLMVSRQHAIEPRPIDLGDILRGLGDMLAGTLGDSIELRVDLIAGLPRILADPGTIEQAVLNLAVNARDAMPDGGVLTLAGEMAPKGKSPGPGSPPARPDGYVCIKVSDTGKGMDAATVSRIFEPFYSTKRNEKGTGLGLAMVYAIINQHRGWVDVRSIVGKGTTFTVFIPAVASSGEPSPAAPA